MRSSGDAFGHATVSLVPIGRVRSPLASLEEAPLQGHEGAPDAWLEIDGHAREALEGLMPDVDIVVLTWLHLARRDALRVHPRGERANPLTGVFATRSQDRPNPIGLHRVRVKETAPGKLKVGPLEAIDGTPVIDIKPVLDTDGRGTAG